MVLWVSFFAKRDIVYQFNIQEAGTCAKKCGKRKATKCKATLRTAKPGMERGKPPKGPLLRRGNICIGAHLVQPGPELCSGNGSFSTVAF